METFLFLFTLLPKQSSRHGEARAVDLPERSFDLARPGVAQPLNRGAGTLAKRSAMVFMVGLHSMMTC